MPSRPITDSSGFRVRFHFSWFIVMVLVALSLGMMFHVANPFWSFWARWIAAGVTAILFFVSVLLHEVAHGVVARSSGRSIGPITLFVFGGVSTVNHAPEEAKVELRVAMAGPIASLALGAIVLGLSHLGNPHRLLYGILWWVGAINIFLGLFNLVPGLPLDGGRMLRAIVWNANGNYLRATMWATRAGKACALLFILAGIFRFFSGQYLSGMWLAFIGWFLLLAAEQNWQRTEIQVALERFTVRDLETPFYHRLAPEQKPEDFLQQLSERNDHRTSLVMDGDDHLLGVIAPIDLKRIPRERWSSTTVGTLMVPRSEVATVSPDDGLIKALETMMSRDLGQLPILNCGVVSGVIRRERIIELLRAEIAADA